MIAFLQDLVFKDFWLKLFSFALAVLMWFTISSAITQQQDGSSSNPILGGASRQSRTLSVPVTVLSSASQVRSCKIQPEAVNVVFEGDPKVLTNLQPADFRVVVDLTGIVAPRLSRQVEISHPPGVTSVKADPEQVQVTFPNGN